MDQFRAVQRIALEEEMRNPNAGEEGGGVLRLEPGTFHGGLDAFTGRFQQPLIRERQNLKRKRILGDESLAELL